MTALKSLMDLRNDILTAKAELGALMNLPPNAEFVLDIPPDMDNPKIVRDLGQIDLEHFALVNRPELRINDYEARIAALEAKRKCCDCSRELNSARELITTLILI